MKKSRKHPATKFGTWLRVNLVLHDYTYEDVAKKLHCSRQAIHGHISGQTSPSYVWIVAYCSIFGANVEEVWELVESDKTIAK